MQFNSETKVDSPLRHLTEQQFMALGGDAVVYVRPIKGRALGQIITTGEFAPDEDFHLVVSADGSPLMVADTEEAVTEWLAGQDLGIVTLH
jgi:hypothetical protein